MKVKGQTDWSTRVRVLGLLLLIDHIVRKLKKGAISISADFAHQFVSKLRRPSRADIPTEPPFLLCKIGILTRVRPAVFAHVKASAVYSFARDYRKTRLLVEVFLPPKLSDKRRLAAPRREQRLNRRYRYRGQLLKDANTVSLASEARPIIAKGIAGKSGDNLKTLISAIDGQNHSVRVNERGQITTSIGTCPKELQPHLLLHGTPTVSCDISHAHWNFLPSILANRLRYVSSTDSREKYIVDGWREHDRLTLLLSQGDFYRLWCIDQQSDAERTEKKKLLNILLNKKNEDSRRNCLYRRLTAEYPITFRAIEDIKRKDHRNLSKQLHRFTADAIAAALLEVQSEGIAAIPHVDALICQRQYHAVVCKALGKQVFLRTGVCAKIGGIRYSPLTEEEEQALAFDETAPIRSPKTPVSTCNAGWRTPGPSSLPPAAGRLPMWVPQ